MFAGEPDHKEGVGPIDPPGNDGVVRNSLGADDGGWFINNISFVLFTHVYLDFRSQVIYITGVGPDENEDFIGGMDMRSVRIPRSAMPYAG
jgi:hypothetical protein